MKENSIEEDIEIIKSLDTLDDIELKNALEHILSDYKRVVKENEELKQDRNNNYQMIALAQNEALGYMQGYEDGKKLKRSAIANIVENQQIYIFNKQMETYKKYIEKLQKENEQLRTEVNSLKAENEELKILKSGIQTLQDLRIEDGKYIVMSKNDFLNGSCKHLLDDYISKQKIKDKIKEIDERIKNPEKISYWDSYTISECIGIRRILQELLERKK